MFAETPIEEGLAAISPGAYPHLEVWEWPVGLDLFLMSLAGGLLILTNGLALWRWHQDHGKSQLSIWTDVLVLPCILGGLFMLWIDLGAKLQALRFFLVFEPTSPMSWGSWLIGLSLLGGLARTAQRLNEPGVCPADRLLQISWMRPAARMLGGVAALRAAIAWRADLLGRGLLATNVVLGTGLGLYTGALLAMLAARPLWANGALPFFFLAYGLAAAGSVLVLTSGRTQMDAARLALTAATFLALFFGAAYVLTTPALLAALPPTAPFAGGWFGPTFWGLGIGMGLVVPLGLEIGAMITRTLRPLVDRLTPWLILGGGLALRQALIYAGQAYAR
ncbi:MAG: NrfD/PsrC family molybdoenzyme membrane anchor subunit [Chloroflexota bacterium]